VGELDYCPFCGSSEVSVDTEAHPLGVMAYVKCLHCAAQGGTFIEETEDEAIWSVIRDWNQKDIRPNTICHKVKRFVTQLEYDLRTFWGRY